jgi:LemA protein
MKKRALYIFGIVAMQMMTSCGYNDMVTKRTEVDKQWGNVQSSYQRRADLIPNLVNTVKGEAKFEQETITQVVEARSRATSMNIDPSKSSPEQMMKWQEAQGQLSSALGRLISITENYPNLQANAAFRELTDQLEGTENRINVERNKYNEAVGTFNGTIQSIPNNIYAGWFGFLPRTFFEADKSAMNVPKVDFGADKK